MIGNKNNSRRTSTDIDTLIGQHTEITGDVKFKGGLRIEGTVKGNVVAAEDPGAILSVANGGRIIGEVRVPHIDLNGNVEGDVYAGERLELDGGAKVKGNVFYKTIQMNAGAEVNGKMVHKPDGRPMLAITKDAEAKATTATKSATK